MDNVLFLVRHGNAHVLTFAAGRESAKQNAHKWLGADKDDYIVTPLTSRGDRIHVSLTLQV